MAEQKRVCIRCGKEPDSFVAYERCRCNHCGLDFVGVATEIAPALRAALESFPPIERISAYATPEQRQKHDASYIAKVMQWDRGQRQAALKR